MSPRSARSGRPAAPEGEWWESYFDADYLVEHEPMFTERRTRREVARVIAAAGLSVGASVLDAPCGQGRHAHLLAEAGCQVTGVDYSKHLLTIARRRRSSTAAFVHGDVRALPTRFRGRFDAVVSLGASFGFFANPTDDEAAIASYARALRPGGTLVLHAPNRDGVAATFIEKDWWEARDGTLVLHEREFDPLSGLLTVTRALARDGELHRRSYRLRLYTATELAAMCARQGLLVTEAFDGWRDRPLRRRSGEMILVAMRDAQSRATRAPHTFQHVSTHTRSRR